jgi:hypothetical protein
VAGDAWIVHNPRFGAEGTHYHTYGLLTPYFKGLTEGRLLGTGASTRAAQSRRATGSCGCRHAPIARTATSRWSGRRIEPRGYIYSYTQVVRGGTGLEIECPYYQIDVKLAKGSAPF